MLRRWKPQAYGYSQLGERVQLRRLVYNRITMGWAVWVDGELRGTWTSLQTAKRRATDGLAPVAVRA